MVISNNIPRGPSGDELPPPRQPATTETRRRDAKRAAMGVNIAALVYALLHKFIMPLITAALSASHLKPHLDWWWLYHVVLGIAIMRAQQKPGFLRGVLFFGFGGAIGQLFRATVTPGWAWFSFILTSAGTFAALGTSRLLLKEDASRPNIKTSFRNGSLLIGSCLLQVLAWQLGWGAGVALPSVAKTNVVYDYPEIKSDSCGLEHFTLKSSDMLSQAHSLVSLVTLKKCGFAPALAVVVDGANLSVKNDSPDFANLHVSSFQNGRWHPLSNTAFESSNNTLVVSSEQIEKSGFVLLTSDARSDAGVVLVVSEHVALSGELPGVPKGKKSSWHVDRAGLLPE